MSSWTLWSLRKPYKWYIETSFILFQARSKCCVFIIGMKWRANHTQKYMLCLWPTPLISVLLCPFLPNLIIRDMFDTKSTRNSINRTYPLINPIIIRYEIFKVFNSKNPLMLYYHNLSPNDTFLSILLNKTKYTMDPGIYFIMKINK